MSKIHFISGLPRSGSTLLAALLNQNPAFKAGMTSQFYGMFAANLKHMSGFNEANSFLTVFDKRNILQNLVNGYYNFEMSRYTTAFDTSRSWTTKTEILFDLFPDARMICCVRNPSWILDSFERIVRKNKYELSKMFNFNPHTNVYTRTNQMTQPDGVVGSAYNNLREAFFGENSDKLMLVTYETLCRTPEFALKAIYEFIGEEFLCGRHRSLDNQPEVPCSYHQYTNVQYSADEFDTRLGTPGLHTVSGPVRPIDPARQTILPPDIFAAHFENDFWNHDGARVKSDAVVI